MSNLLKQIFNFFRSSGVDDSLIENALYGGPSSSIFTTSAPSEKIIIRDSSSKPGQCYMGVTLPRQLIKLFPEEKTYLHLSANNLSDLDLKTENSGLQSEQNNSETQLDRRNSSYKLLKHDKKLCLLCHRDEKSPVVSPEEQNEQQKVRLDVLRHVERLANPVWTKQSKQALLHLKQRHFQLFQDVCLYSEVCNMVSTCGYRLTSRRFLQELFLDLNFIELMSEYNRLLRESLFTNRPLVNSPIKEPLDETSTGTVMVSASDTNRNVIKGFEVKSPDKEVKKRNILDLKLTCSENKFPIKHSLTNFVPESVKSSLRSPESYKSFNIGNSLEMKKAFLQSENSQNKHTVVQAENATDTVKP